ncbi:MAG: hypothetical protein IPM18_03235 [Phycisphaerales bacterium]|nr:hypothetical protein [Phycisphaerales bacterium]
MTSVRPSRLAFFFLLPITIFQLPAVHAAGTWIDAATGGADPGERAGRAPATFVRQIDDSGLSVAVHCFGFELAAIGTPAGPFTQIQIPEATDSGAPGEPALPVIRKLFGVRPGARVTVAAAESGTHWMRLADLGHASLVVPVQPLVEETDAEEFTLALEAYRRDTYAPSPVVSVRALGISRGVELYMLEVHPVTYNPVQGALRIVPHFEIQLTFAGGDAARTDLRPVPGLHRTLLNSPVEPAERTAGNYLIITAPAFHNSAPLNQFIAAKEARGFDVMVYAPPLGTTRPTIKAYIEGLWNTPDAPDFVLIVGDAIRNATSVAAEFIPIYAGDGTKRARTDNPYVCMDGPGDWLPDIPYGRFPARTVAELQVMIGKTLVVEAGDYDPAYARRALFMGGSDIWTAGEALNAQIISTFLQPAGIAVDQIYESTGATATDINNAINRGYFLVSYYGHAAGFQAWATPLYRFGDIEALQNENLYPFIASFACSTINVDYTDPTQSPGFIEKLMLEPGKGAAAGYGCATNQTPYTWSQWANLYRFFYTSFYADGIRELGVGSIAAGTKFAGHYGPDNPASQDFVESWYMLGDPSLRLPEPPASNYLMLVPEAWSNSAPVLQLQAARAARGLNVVKQVVPAGTTRAAIKEMVKARWGTSTAPDYLLIIGDTAGQVSATATTIPHWKGVGSKQATTDLPYACMDDGDDWYPEFPVGRFPAATLSQLEAMVEKTLKLESGDYPDPDYLRRVTFLANPDTNGTAEPTAEWIITNYLEPNDYAPTRIYAAQGGTTAQVAAALNSGSLLTTYMGHSGSSGWWDPSFGQNDVRNLQNTGLYGVVLGWSCNTSHFDYDECFGETWLRVADKGAAAYISASDYIYWGSPAAWLPSAVLEKAFFRALFEEGIWELGPAWNSALYHFLEVYGEPATPGGLPTQNADIVRNFFEEFVLLGDPALYLPPDSSFRLTAAPASQTVCTTQGGTAFYTLHVDRFGSFEEIVSLSLDGLPAGAAAEISVNDLPAPYTSVLTLTGLAAVAPGSYTLTITAEADLLVRSQLLTLHVASAVPGVPVPQSPAPQATNVGRQPTLAWIASSQAVTYDVVVSRTATFSQPVFNATTSETSAFVTTMLDPATTYYWRVRATNGCSSSAYSATHSFTTLSQADYFTQQFTGNGNDFNLANRTLRFTPDGGANFYAACLVTASTLPTDPAGGTALVLSDDGSRQIQFTPAVWLYGVPYTSLFVNANGHLTFGQADGTWQETLAVHFSLPRIAPLFDDLNPASGGTISWKQTADRIAVTWQNVPEFSSSAPNTFQVELFHHGAIHLTWTGIACRDAIVGLSAGTGIPTDFVPSQHANSSACPPPGACCQGSFCTLLDESVCAAQGGTYLGAAVDCAPNPCISYDASCLIISEVVQGAESGDCPRWLEITNTGTTDFAFIQGGIIVQTGLSTHTEVNVPLGGLLIPAGQAVVINSTFDGACSGAFQGIYGSVPDVQTPAQFGHGHERLLLTDRADGGRIIDMFGLPGVDNLGQPTEFTRGYVTRRPAWNSGAGGDFYLNEWELGGVDSLVGENPTALLLTLTTPGTHNVDQVCTPHRPGDLNCDGAVNFSDISPFILALKDTAAYEAAYPNCPFANRDLNRDGVVNFADISPFIAQLKRGG